MMSARRIFIQGRVQGVFFREWTVSRARELDITGWVRNLSDGRVEVYAAGAQGNLDRFVAKLREGAPASQVAGLEVLDAPLENLDGFLRRQSL